MTQFCVADDKKLFLDYMFVSDILLESLQKN